MFFFSITFAGHQLWILFLSISCLKRVILPYSMIFVFCGEQLLKSLTSLPGRSDYLSSSCLRVQCRMYWHSHQKRTPRKPGKQGSASHGKMCHSTVAYPTSLASYASSAGRTHSLLHLESLRFLALLGSTSPHDHLKLEAWESSAAWIAVVPRNLTELEKQF